MKLSASEQESLTALLTRIYLDIRDIEEQFQLLAGEADFRPRIEHFHDAVRAFTGKDPRETERGGRLAVERLAYDVSCLRYIQSAPLAPFKPQGANLSPNTSIVKAEQGLVLKTPRADRATRERLSELYQHYGVLFAALLKPFADADYHERVSDLNEDVREINAITQQLDAIMKKKGNAEQLVAAVHNLEDDEMRVLLMQFVQQQRYRKKDDVKKLVQLLKAESGKKDKRIAGIETAHMNYVTTQLSIFEDSKDMLKKMAERGMNLVGKFVEASLAESRREMGR